MNFNETIIQELIRDRVKSPADLALVKRKIAKKYQLSCPNNIALLKTYHELIRNKSIKLSLNIENLLRTRPIRSLSGIVNISVLTKPYPCPGKCVYCPKEKGIPKSYLSGEPAVERAKKLKFDPYLQVKKRMEMLENEGHPTDKIELRIIGGTWSYYPQKYQTWFIKKCFQAANNNSGNRSLVAEQKLNEKSKNRIVGLSIETRPDFINEKEIKALRGFGVTKVELGVQSVFDQILEKNQRGHDVKTVKRATGLLKDAGFKVSYQMMLNLPGSNPKKDIKSFEAIFQEDDFKPDLLKIYPCALVKEAPLYQSYLKNKYCSYSEKVLVKIITEIKKKVPNWIRIERITRDIPSQKIVLGPAKISNLRQVVNERMKEAGFSCRCIRCKEIKGNYSLAQKIIFFRDDYRASGGKEIFLSFEDKKREKLYSLLRLRVPSQYYYPEKAVLFPALKGTAIIREVHTYGQLHPLKSSQKMKSPQHKGLGKRLIKKAEEIAKKEFRVKKIAVISAVGVRDYWRQLGYKLENGYMVKNL